MRYHKIRMGGYKIIGWDVIWEDEMLYHKIRLDGCDQI